MRKWLSILVVLVPVFIAGCDKPIIIDLKGIPNIPVQPLQPAPPRFQLVMHPEFPGKLTYILDTQTGALWSRVQFVDMEGKPTVWQQEEFISIGQESSSGYSPQNPMSFDKFKYIYSLIKEVKEKGIKTATPTPGVTGVDLSQLSVKELEGMIAQAEAEQAAATTTPLVKPQLTEAEKEKIK